MTTRARITLGADDATAPAFASVKARFASLQGQIASFATSMSATLAPMAAIGGVFVAGGAFARVVDGLDKLNDLRDATGASIENLSALEDIAARTGSSMAAAGDAVIKLNKALGDAKPGGNTEAAFRALGLSVAQLKQADPAEALQRVAVALAGFADDGNKARLVQDLFGKSLREVAPLLGDLANAGQLNATVTTEQALAAEKFNQQLAALGKNAEDVSRAIASRLLPVINQTFADAKTGGLEKVLGLDSFNARLEQASTAYRLFAIGLKRQQVKGILESSPADPAALLELQQLDAAAAALADRFKAARTEFLRIGESTAGAGRGFVNPDIARPSLPALTGPDKPAVDLAGKYVDKLREAMLATQQLTAVDRARLDINTGALGVVSEATRQQVLAFAQGLDSLNQIQLFEKGRQQMMAEGLAVFAQTRTEAEKQAIAVQRATELVNAGAISWETYGRVATKGLGDALKALDEQMGKLPNLSKPFKEIDVFAEQAARNIQDALGDGMLAVVEGKLNSLGDIFSNTVKRMAAQAAAAQLGKALFGDFGSPGGGSLGGLVGSLFAGARASGGPVQAGRAYLVGERGPEMMVPAASGAIVPNHALGGGQSFTFAPVVHASGDVSPQIIAAIRAEIAHWHTRYMRQMATRGA